MIPGALSLIGVVVLAMFIVGCTVSGNEVTSIVHGLEKVKRVRSISSIQPVKRKSGAKVLESFYAIVVRVIDGDSLRARMKDGKEVTIRFAFVDAPEMHQKYGVESKQNLEKMVQPGVRVKVQVTMSNPSYGRTVGLIKVGEACLSTYQIETGFAHVDHRYNKIPELVTKEAEARAQRLGLWKQKNPVLPSTWRKEQKLKRAA